MSAIAGIVNLDGRPVDPQDLHRMSSALRSLGRDREGMWATESAGFVHRLMRFTPEDRYEEQPLEHPESGTVLVADARVDYRQDLAVQLGIERSELDRTADSRLLISAWLKWGPDLVDQVLGSFSLVVWSARERRLFAACSVGESPPLYYHFNHRRLVMATMPRALFAVDGMERRLEPRWLAGYLVGNRRAIEESPWQGVRQLPLGHRLELRQGRLAVQAFWNPGGVRPLPPASDPEYREAFRERFDLAVSQRLRTTGQAAILLSGGLDSTLIAASAASALAVGNRTLFSLTQVPEPGYHCDPSFRLTADESPLVASLAGRHPNLQTLHLPASGLTFMELGDSFLEHAEAPIRSPANLHWLLEGFRLAGQKGATICLDGDAGNEVFSWDGAVLAAWLLRSGRWLEAWRQTTAFPAGTATRFKRLAVTGLVPLLSPVLGRAVQRHRWPAEQQGLPFTIRYSPIHPGFLKSSRIVESARAAGHDFDAVLRLDRQWKRGQVLLRADRFWSAAQRSWHGVDRRSPARDRRLAEFCLALPVSQFAWNGVRRRLARTAFTDRVPAEIADRKGRGLQTADWIFRLNQRTHRIREVLDSMHRSPWCVETLDLPRLSDLANSIPAPDTAYSTSVWHRWEHCLSAGLAAGQFLLWLERGAPTVDEDDV